MKVFWRFLALRRLPFIGPVLHHLSHAVLAPETRVWVRIRKGSASGFWITVNPRTGRDLYEGTRERAVQEALRNYLKPGMVFYDLGANCGLFTLVGARHVGTSGRVFAFEPDPAVCQRLRENVARNGLSQVQIVETAVWSKTGEADFVRADPDVSPDMGLGRIGEGVSGSETIRIESVALDDFVKGAPPPDMIKCDVEGGEAEVLEGAQGLLRRWKPIILCETHSVDGAERVFKSLVQEGYSVGLLDSNHLLALPAKGAPL